MMFKSENCFKYVYRLMKRQYFACTLYAQFAIVVSRHLECDSFFFPICASRIDLTAARMRDNHPTHSSKKDFILQLFCCCISVHFFLFLSIPVFFVVCFIDSLRFYTIQFDKSATLPHVAYSLLVMVYQSFCCCQFYIFISH